MNPKKSLKGHRGLNLSPGNGRKPPLKNKKKAWARQCPSRSLGGGRLGEGLVTRTPRDGKPRGREANLPGTAMRRLRKKKKKLLNLLRRKGSGKAEETEKENPLQEVNSNWLRPAMFACRWIGKLAIIAPEKKGENLYLYL